MSAALRKERVLVTGASTSKEDAFRALVDTHLGAAP